MPAILLPRLYRSFHSRLLLSTCVPTVLLHCGTGISTCCPSTTSFDLALGPDLPRADQLYSGNLKVPTYPEQISFTLETLDIRPEGFPPSSRYSFRHSLFLKVHIPFQVMLPPFKIAPLPLIHKYESTASAACFSPGHFRRRTSRLVSCYALFQCLAASEPTS